MGQTSETKNTVEPSAADSVRLITKHFLSEAKLMSDKRILVAEDNIVNQKVALRQLSKLGYVADTVGNGREAVEALATIAYDLILMDCQMPELDGYEATAAIRRRELSTSRHIPIIAMTANVMKGAREKCMEVGMDDFVSKPVKEKELAEVLERWASKCLPMQPISPVAVEASTYDAGESDCWEVALRLAELVEEYGNAFTSKLVDTFLLNTESRMNKLRLLVEAGDTAAVAREGHALKGSCGNIGALRLAKLCAQLEKEGHKHSQDKAQAILIELEAAITHLQPVLNKSLAVEAV
jgi:CheY-like chemotaxis protein/HPt (histidine-containing phosphotransfer) domain-containing protein